MRIAVFGIGGVGGYYGGRLAQAGAEVIFIARKEHVQAIRENGLVVESAKGDFTILPIQVTEDPSKAGLVDMVLLGVKAWQVTEVAQAITPMLGEHTGVVPLQNGVDAPAQIAAVLGAQHALGGLCQISVFKAGPGHIRHAGIEPLIAFGELSHQPSRRVDDLRQAFESAGVKVDTPDDIQASMWRKFLFIAAISGVGAVSRAPIGVTRTLPETRRMLIQAMQEIANLAEKRGIELDAEIVAATMEFIDSMAANIMPSMQRDLQEGRPSELEAQNGAVVRMGSESKIPTPTHSFIYASLLPQEIRARGEIL